jgi:hypothetical protein
MGELQDRIRNKAIVKRERFFIAKKLSGKKNFLNESPQIKKNQ